MEALSAPTDAPLGSEQRPFDVVVVDRSELVGWGFRAMLGALPRIKRCLYAPTPDAAEELVERYEPRLALVSTTFPDIAAGEIALRLQALDPTIRAIILSAVSDKTRCWGHPVGAWGWVEREWTAERLIDVIHAVGNGEHRLPSQTAPRLSPQQMSVLELIAAGATNREIAHKLDLSPNTVKEYAGAVFRRLGARNRAEAVRRAQRWGIVG
jgi:DNA-binding NarL/FixJ family response regulator